MESNNKYSLQMKEQGSNALELESIDFFVRLMSLLGLPRSVGEIYGFLYFSPNPLTMDQIATRLEISIGSASQGLKTLRSLKAVKTSYVQGDRRDHYHAESEFRRLFSTFLNDEILPHLESAKDRIKRMENEMPLKDSEDFEFYNIRIEKLKRLIKASGRLLPALARLFKL